jgi:hypothetical protein
MSVENQQKNQTHTPAVTFFNVYISAITVELLPLPSVVSLSLLLNFSLPSCPTAAGVRCPTDVDVVVDV